MENKVRGAGLKVDMGDLAGLIICRRFPYPRLTGLQFEEKYCVHQTRANCNQRRGRRDIPSRDPDSITTQIPYGNRLGML
jgi:hypothetical protein